MVAVLFWTVIVVFCVVAEIHTNALVAIFVGFGAAVAFFLAIASVWFPLQALVWLVLTAGGLTLLRPLALRRFPRHRYEIDMSKPTSTTLTNLKGFVEQTVGNEQHPGRVKIQGESWKAVTDWPEEIPDGTSIVVRKAYGTTLWVDPN